MKIHDLSVGPAGCGHTRLTSDGLSLLLEYEYFDGPKPLIGGISFQSIVAYRFSAEMHTSNYPDEAYDSVLEIVSSPWKKELQLAEPSGIDDIASTHHFAVFLSSNGYLEVLADACSLIDPRPGNLK
jgi:hypothetical protein